MTQTLQTSNLVSTATLAGESAESHGLTALRDPAKVPVTLINTPDGLPAFASALQAAARVAIDTETHSWTKEFNGVMRVLSAAVRYEDGTEQAFVVDIRDFDPHLLQSALSGVSADGWNANFDARVIEDAVFKGKGSSRIPRIRWYDCQFADAVYHQGMNGFSWYHGLAWASERYLGLLVTGKGTTQTSFTESDDLTDEQVAYAAADAVETLWVGDVIRERLEATNLSLAAMLEMGARPFLDKMENCGLPLDWAGWESHLKSLEPVLEEVLGRIANLTGGGQATLFSDAEQPTWNPGSDDQVKAKLNEHSGDEVRKYLKASTGEERLLAKPDKADKDALTEIGGDLAKAILEFRDVSKTLSTYGDSLKHWLDGNSRMHPQYLQVIGTDTGRLSSRNPNAQNFTPLLKPFFRPLHEGRVFVYADLSQAELRWLAHVSGDDAMLTAFREGRDIHVATAERMFQVDMATLEQSDPKLYKVYRSKAKTLNFGIVYGLGPTALARRLSLGGVPTTPDEAKQLLAMYLQTYPGVALWMKNRDEFVRDLAANLPAIDWTATFRLAELMPGVKSARRSFREIHSRWPTVPETAERMASRAKLKRDLEDELGHEPTDVEVDAAVEANRADVAWVLQFEDSVVVCADGAPFMFASYTEAQRRRQFNVSTDSLLLSACELLIQSKKPDAQVLRNEFVSKHPQLTLTQPNGKYLSRDAIKKAFEDRVLRREFVQFALDRLAPERAGQLLRGALSDRVRAMGNAYRNAPIQGGVADAVLLAYGALFERLAELGVEYWPVQTVHDSITIEVNVADAPMVARVLKETLEESLAHFCSSVPAVADADVRASLDDNSVIEELTALIASAEIVAVPNAAGVAA